jgi:hypothetical protein
LDVGSPTPCFRWLGVLVSVGATFFAVLSYFGVWDRWRGVVDLERIASQLDTSYANVSRQVHFGDAEWPTVLTLIERYSKANLPDDRQPRALAREQAIFSAQRNGAEWTAPTTRILLFYTDWPQPGHGPYLINKDFYVVGTLGDFHEWIRRYKSDFDFLWRGVIFGALSACVGLFLALPEQRR